MSEHIMENLTIRPLNDVSEKLSKRANEHEIRNGTLSALKERCDRLESENAKLHEYVTKLEQANIVLDSDNTELLNDMRDMQMIVGDNHRLRELCKSMRCALADFDDKVYLAALDDTLVDAGFDLQELRIGVDR